MAQLRPDARQALLLVAQQLFDQPGLGGQVRGILPGQAEHAVVGGLEHVQGVQVGFHRQQAVGLAQRGTGALGKVQGAERLAVGFVRLAHGEQHRHPAAPHHLVEGGVAEAFEGLLVVCAHQQQVRFERPGLLQDAVDRLAPEQVDGAVLVEAGLLALELQHGADGLHR
nr:hypothetical protein [Pseudomonas aeruginosa]